MTVPPISLSKLLSDAAQLERQGVTYKLGAKAHALSVPLSSIERLDCSGYIRYALFRATGGALIVPDGSQNIREWAENAGLHKVAHYSDCNKYLTAARLFICFIKPGANSAGSIGHCWLVGQFDGDAAAETLECCGSLGVGSRSWDTGILKREFFSCYELPTTK